MSRKAQLFLKVVVPVADYQNAEPGVSRRAPRPGSIKGKTAMLLPSQQSSSPPFINALVQRMAAETEVKRVFAHNPDWPFFHPTLASAIPPEIDRLAGECDLAVVGVAY